MTCTTSNYNMLTHPPPRSRSGRFSDAETGPKVEEELTRKSLGHDISELESGGHMKNSNFAQ
jgi:hypothetical protein